VSNFVFLLTEILLVWILCMSWSVFCCACPVHRVFRRSVSLQVQNTLNLNGWTCSFCNCASAWRSAQHSVIHRVPASGVLHPPPTPPHPNHHAVYMMVISRLPSAGPPVRPPAPTLKCGKQNQSVLSERSITLPVSVLEYRTNPKETF
jgi:hypothetical protein